MGLPFGAVYLPEGAVTGVNATIYPPQEDIKWLLAFLNSSLVTYLVRGVLIRSNMVTSGYVSCIPLLNFNEQEKDELNKISDKVINGDFDTTLAVKKVDDIIENQNLIPFDVLSTIENFSKNLSKFV